MYPRRAPVFAFAILALVPAVGLTVALLPAAAPRGTLDRWLRDSRLLPYTEPRLNQPSLYPHARHQGSVTAYLYSSRNRGGAPHPRAALPCIKANSPDISHSRGITTQLATSAKSRVLNRRVTSKKAALDVSTTEPWRS